ncbi:MAG: HAMP domain-containing protein [Blastocatellia bacterium]|nr:HAMP domain-containing protein [Blastocatellia bacterium]
MKLSLSVKISLLSIVLISLTVALGGWLNYRQAKEELEAQLGLQLEGIARTASLQIAGEDISQIQKKEDVETETYRKLKTYLAEVVRVNGLNPDTVYVLRPNGNGTEFVVVATDNPLLGNRYELKAEMVPVLKEGKSNHTGVYRDAHGTWLSGYAPISEKSGKIVALLEVDYRVEVLLAHLVSNTQRIVFTSYVVAIFGILASIVVAQTITRRLRMLSVAAEQMSLGNLESPIPVVGKDEISELSVALERMRESLKTSNELLRQL